MRVSQVDQPDSGWWLQSPTGSLKKRVPRKHAREDKTEACTTGVTQNRESMKTTGEERTAERRPLQKVSGAKGPCQVVTPLKTCRHRLRQI